MITIRAKNVYTFLSVQAPLTSICTVYNLIPHEIVEIPTENHLFIEKVSDNRETDSMNGVVTRTARMSITIVCKELLWIGEDVEKILADIVDVLDWLLLWGCNIVDETDGIFIESIIDDWYSPILFNEKGRAYLARDYLFTYKAYD